MVKAIKKSWRAVQKCWRESDTSEPSYCYLKKCDYDYGEKGVKTQIIILLDSDISCEGILS